MPTDVAKNTPGKSGPATTMSVISQYQQRASGMDLALKIFIYYLRLIIARRGLQDPQLAQKCSSLVTEFTHTRMIANMLKVLSTVKIIIALKGSARPAGERLFMILSNCVRAFEQMAGDVGVLQMHWFQHWSRQRISWHYKFYKSWALCLGAVAESLRSVKLAQQVFADGKITRSCNKAVTESNAAHRKELCTSLLYLIRSLGDMYIYFQWIERHNPNCTAVAVLGMYSGILGVVCTLTNLDKA